jgi:hypothetical protein
MPCLFCGDEICRCSPSPACATPGLLSADLSSKDLSSAALPSESEALSLEVEPASEAASQANTASSDSGAAEDSSAWRTELSARLSRYHARRKPRPPRYPSLALRFDEGSSTSLPLERPFLHHASNQALAFDEVSECDSIEMSKTGTFDSVEFPTAIFSSDRQELSNSYSTVASSPAPVTAKIIEFPRSWEMPPAPLDELAEPVMTHPRILEVPEVAPPPPALGGITIEPAKQPEIEKRPGIDIPLQTAPLSRRIAAAVIDNAVIGIACALFALVFWKLTAIRPPQIQTIAVLAGLLGGFWAAYQYLLIIYAGTTPGLLLARLELCRFDGSLAHRRLRRWRVLASFLSAVSLGMGYIWVFLDEDSLCWHDRITHTYMARRSNSNPETPRP